MILPGRDLVRVAKQLASQAALAPKRVLPAFGLTRSNCSGCSCSRKR